VLRVKMITPPSTLWSTKICSICQCTG
jgi:hypothetical protein